MKGREKIMKKKLISIALSTALLMSSAVGLCPSVSAEGAKTPEYQKTPRLMEKLNRGLIAVKTEADTREQTVNGVYLSWRLLGDESLENQAFDIYKNGTKLTTTAPHAATCYIDTAGTANDKYKVVKAGEDAADEPEVTPSGTNAYAKPSEVGNGNSLKNSFSYIDIPIVRPEPVNRMGDGKESYYYTLDKDHEAGANDASIGDLDGDGDYELVLKWDPVDSKDSAGADYTGNVYIDAYEIDPNNGGYKWRIDLGKNVTAGAHYTQFMVYDLDGDGKAEVAMKTAPGSKDGTGKYVSEVGDTEEIRNVDNTASFIGTGKLKGKNPFTQYLTIFDGETGEALYTTEFIPYETAEDKYWGDGSAKYNRSERYLAAVAYLDGVHPSLVMCRGYYHDAVIRAYNWDGENKELTMLWQHVGKASERDTTLYGQGNHNLSIGDIDGDGKDEIVYGSAALDDDGRTVLGNTKLGHGDAMHMSDFNNDGKQEVFSVKEDGEGFKKFAEDLRDPATGKHFWDEGKIVTKGDNGRGVMDNIDDAYAKTHENARAIGWSSGLTNAHDLNGDDLKAKPGAAGKGSFDNFLVYWDADLGRELLDANIIQKYDAANGWTKRFYGPSDGYTLVGGSTFNYTKRNVSLVADLWGDWREEIIMPTGTGKDESPALRIFTSTMPTDYRLTTLMHDSQYRLAIAWQNVAYNQPPHTSYYIGSAALATDESGNELNYLAPEVAYTNVAYEVDDVAVSNMTLEKDSIRLKKGKSESLRAVFEPADATNKGVTWTSSDTSVATVSNGIVTGVENGNAVITAVSKDGEITATCDVEVYLVQTTSIELSEDRIELGLDDTATITAAIKPNDATDTSVEWISTDPFVATVQDGTVKAVGYGKAVITAQTNDTNLRDACIVEVKPMSTSNQTGEDSFVTSNTDAETKTSLTATSASITQTNANTGAEVHKDFTPYDENIAKLEFKFNSGGQKDSSGNWSWTGREYTFGFDFVDTEGNLILNISQAQTSKAQDTMAQIGNGTAEKISGWSRISESGESPLARSSTRWIVTIEFDYDNDSCTATLAGSDGSWVKGVTYQKTFPLNGAKFRTFKGYTTKDGTGAITVSPSISDVKYTLVQQISGRSDVLYSKGINSENDWSTDDLADWTYTGDIKPVIDSESGRLWYNAEQPASGYSASKSFNIADNTLVTYDVDWYLGTNPKSLSNIEYIQFGDALRIGYTTGKAFVSMDGNASVPESYDGITKNDDGTFSANDTKSILNYENTTSVKNVRVIFDTTNNTIKSLTFDGKMIEAYTDYQLSDDADVSSVSFGLQRDGDTEAADYQNGIDRIRAAQYIIGETEPDPTMPPEPTEAPKPTNTPTVSDDYTVDADGNKVEVTLTRVENTAKNTVIGVLYESDNSVAECKLFEIAENSDKAELTFEKNISDYTLKVFIWDGFDNMSPVFDKVFEQQKQ